MIHELLTINVILSVKSVFPIKCHQKLFRIGFLDYITSPHTEKLEITRIKIIAIVDAKVFTVALFFCIRIAILSPRLEYFFADLRLKYTYDCS